MIAARFHRVLVAMAGGLALLAPAAAPAAAAPPPVSTCSLVGATRSCDLYAETGTVNLPGEASLPVWGFRLTPGAATRPGGPPIVVNQGETVKITLHNDLGAPLSLGLPQQAIEPDMTGVAAGGTKIYTFTASQPGTSIYEAGQTTRAQAQVAMGLAGALIVRPSAGPGSAYGAGTSFDDEAALVLSEVDPRLNRSANPYAFDMATFSPTYWLINGATHPDTDPIATAPGRVVLLRYVNGGVMDHSMSLLGLHQSIVGEGGARLPFAYSVVAENVNPGSSLDAIVSVPAATPGGAQIPLYEANLHLYAGSPPAAGQESRSGGMLTFLTTPGTPADACHGPATSNLALAPASTSGAAPVAISATLTGCTPAGGPPPNAVTAAEYFVDAVGPVGTGTPMTASPPGFGNPTANVTATLSVADLAALPSGAHTIYVRGQDSAGNWGAARSATLDLDKSGPTVGGVALSPNPTKGGTAPVALTATANDAYSGNKTVTAAEYFVDTLGAPGTGTAMSAQDGAFDAPTEAVQASVDASGLPEGSHTLHLRALDALGNWGPVTTIALRVDRTGPGTSGVSAFPSPNNGTRSVNPNTFEAQVDATVTDPVSNGIASNVTAAEGFVDTVGANGTGFVFIPKDGAFDSPSEAAYVRIPLSQIAAMSQGPHTISVRGLDAAGNWGPTATTTLIIDKTGPTASAVAAAPTPTNNAATVALTASAADPANGAAPASNVVAAEWFAGADPGQGNGTPMSGTFGAPTASLTATIPTASLAPGLQTLSVRARDAAGNWGVPATTQVDVTIFVDGFESGNTSAWSATSGGSRISVTAAARRPTTGGAFGLQTTIAGNTPSYVQDNHPNNEASYHATFAFNPNSTNTNGGATRILVGLNGAGTQIFALEFRKSGSSYQIRATVLRAGGTSTTSWFTVSNAYHTVELTWASATAGSASLRTDGTLRQTLSGINTSAYKLETIRLGPSAGLASGMSGTEYYDLFRSTR